jgi:uncharacterized protein YjiS (DUF1127 family)
LIGIRANRAKALIWLRRRKTRRRLRDLDGRELDDIGLTERQRQCECAKWFWQAVVEDSDARHKK